MPNLNESDFETYFIVHAVNKTLGGGEVLTH